MKVNNSAAKIYQNIPLHKIGENQKANGENNNTNTQKTKVHKINIPSNFAEQKVLTKNEQEFFQKLYPKAKKEIQQYMQHQNKVDVDKGKYIDVKG